MAAFMPDLAATTHCWPPGEVMTRGLHGYSHRATEQKVARQHLDLSFFLASDTVEGAEFYPTDCQHGSFSRDPRHLGRYPLEGDPRPNLT